MVRSQETPFVVAVEASDEGRPQLLLLHVVTTHDGDEIEKLAQILSQAA